MEEGLSLFLPSKLLDHFKLKEVKELGNRTTKQMEYHLYLEEKNILPSGYERKEYESKGFYQEKTIRDFPIRGRGVFLKIRRRVWRHTKNKNKVIKSNYSFIAEGCKLTEELSDFLKYSD